MQEKIKNHQFTYHNDSEVEEYIVDILQQIGNEFSEKINASLYLGGGYGRGDGGIYTESDGVKKLYNDLDFFIITREKKASDLAILHDISTKWHNRVHIDIDFGPAKYPHELKKVQHTLMFQDLKHGYLQIAGSEDFLQNFKAIDAKEIPLLEAVRLLVNRGMGMLLAENEKNPDFTTRNLHKLALGCGDALLISRQEYDYSSKNREKLLEKWEFSHLYKRALAFKFSPNNEPCNSFDLYKEIWLQTVKKIANFNNKTELYSLFPKKAKNLPRWVIKNAGQYLDFDLFVEPRLKILYRMYEYINGGYDQKNLNHLIKIWKKFE